MAAQAQITPKHIYVYGVATSFTDSTIYVTDIQEVDSAWVTAAKFLYSRDNYSYQLRTHLTEKGMARPVCTTIFALKRKDIDRKYAATKKRYFTGSQYDAKLILASEFRYSPIRPDAEEIAQEDPKVARAAMKAKIREAKAKLAAQKAENRRVERELREAKRAQQQQQ